MGIGNFVIQRMHNEECAISYHDGEGYIERRLVEAGSHTVEVGSFVRWQVEVGYGKTTTVRALLTSERCEEGYETEGCGRLAVILEPCVYRGEMVELPSVVWVEQD